MTSRRALTLSMAVLASACSAAPPAQVDLSPLAARLRECGILGPGLVTATEIVPFYAPDACYVDCLSSAPCTALVARACGLGTDVARACDQECAHRCDNGALVRADAVCDGTDECGDGSDERGCPTFRCDDGTAIAAIGRCDGFTQCSGGADERSCPNTCLTTWGQRLVVSPYWHCNGSAQCADGSDEVGCTTFDCGNGQIVTTDGRDVRCDGVTDCWQTGADERDCPARAARVVMCAP